MGIYINIEYLQIIHYYYFFMGVFSFFSAVIFTTAFPYYGLMFSLLFVLHLLLSWYLSWVMVKRLREELVFNIVRYTINHVFITFLTAGLTIMFWYLNLFQELVFMRVILTINFFVFFIGALWYLFTRFEVVRKLFIFRDIKRLDKAKGIAISLGKERGMPIPPEIKKYKTGSDKEIDGILFSIWEQKNRDEVEDVVKEFFILFYEKGIEKLRRRIKEMKFGSLKKTGDLIKEYEKLIKEYEKRIIKLKGM